ncbi:MAG: bifunctional diaminohydroxyphosphoribosylaminopyrimidine deaminase/5-amino-6-(5-phosphoribosylamino)uracil reductase RibD, partial [Actinobacteria bacterium]|nr:bifunctional diaminohydroxyphosphoribosylaminopyrimidine deaminase/5-amino-6-(5-phosphoribosylamino)uracil reductase RibD [Actinomycetota bacterium]
MSAAIDAAESARLTSRPNPWVGAAVVDSSGAVIATGATEPVGGRHAEVVALGRACAEGATLAVTLEPCSHHGRTPPCVEAIIAAGVARVLIGVEDPDPRVCGGGIAALREAGVEVVTGVLADQVEQQLGAYLHHRRTGRPYVIAKMAAT